MINYNLVRPDRPRARGRPLAVHLDYLVIHIKDLAELFQLEATAVLVSKVGGKKLFLISIYNRSELQRIAAELRRIFERLALNRLDHEFIIVGDLNALHTDWGFRRARKRGRELWNFVEHTRPFFGIRAISLVSLTRYLFDRYQRINRADPNVAIGTLLIKEEIARVRKEITEEWKKVKWRRDVVKLERVAHGPRESFLGN